MVAVRTAICFTGCSTEVEENFLEVPWREAVTSPPTNMGKSLGALSLLFCSLDISLVQSTIWHFNSSYSFKFHVHLHFVNVEIQILTLLIIKKESLFTSLWNFDDI